MHPSGGYLLDATPREVTCADSIPKEQSAELSQDSQRTRAALTIVP